MKIPSCWLLLLGLLLHCGAHAETPEIEWTPLATHLGTTKGIVQLSSGVILGAKEHFIDGEHRVNCTQSLDGGRTWKTIGTIARQKGHATLGDGHFLHLTSGNILFSYRHNLLGETDKEIRHYSIRIAISRDEGKTWHPHSIVATAQLDPAQEPETQRGLWSSFLLETREGVLHCIYDDEDTPHRNGFQRHQWLTLRTWNPNTQSWENPVTVSRAKNPDHLSRSGMPTAVELPSGRLLCAFEDVRPEPPHANRILYTTSDDGGRQWSWQQNDRHLLYESSQKPNHLSLSPSLIRLQNGNLLCLFATDEDRATPGIAGTPPSQLHLDIKSTTSFDDGQTWSSSTSVFNQTHRNYMPCLLETADGHLLATFIDFSLGKSRTLLGRPLPKLSQ